MAVMQIVGIRPTKFKGSHGDDVSGRNYYMIYPLEKGEGHGTDRVFATDRRLVESGYAPQLGDMVEIKYNRFGKFDSFLLVQAAPEK